MPARNIGVYDTLQEWCRTREPDCAFAGSTRRDFEAWRAKFRRHYRRCLGTLPRLVPPRIEFVERVDRGDYIREKLLFDSSPGVTVPAYLLTPKGLREGEKRPGILAAHGHGNGKVDICGPSRETGGEAGKAVVAMHNYEYAIGAVREGYVVIAPDWMPFGERRAPAEWVRPYRDGCNVVDLALQYFGINTLAQNVWDGMRAIDLLCAHAHVDARRLGVIGLSYGGTMSTHLLINDRRLKAGVVSGYLSTVRGDALNMRGRGNFCGSQHIPQLLLHGDIPDMLGLAAPKAVLFEMGKRENCFHYPDMAKAYRHLRRIYTAAGCPERLAADVYDGDHRWNGVKAWPWLKRWL